MEEDILKEKFPSALVGVEAASDLRDNPAYHIWADQSGIGLVRQGDQAPTFKSWDDFRPVAQITPDKYLGAVDAVGELTDETAKNILESAA